MQDPVVTLFIGFLLLYFPAKMAITKRGGQRWVGIIVSLFFLAGIIASLFIDQLIGM